MLNTVSTYSLFSEPRVAVSNLQTKLTQAETEETTGQLADPVQSLGSQVGLFESLSSQAASLANIQSSNSIVQTGLSVSQNALTSISSDAQTHTDPGSDTDVHSKDHRYISSGDRHGAIYRQRFVRFHGTRLLPHRARLLERRMPIWNRRGALGPGGMGFPHLFLDHLRR